MDAGEELERQITQVMHPTRARILAAMGQETMAPSDVAAKLGYGRRDIGAVAYHFRMLQDRNVLRVVRTEPARGSIKTFYAVQPNVLKRVRRELVRLVDQIDAILGSDG